MFTQMLRGSLTALRPGEDKIVAAVRQVLSTTLVT